MKAFPLCLLLLGCSSPAEPKPLPAKDTDFIPEMCLHLKSLECVEGEDVYNDDLPGPVDVPNQSCSDFYRGLQEQGFSVNPKCVLLAPSCDDIEEYRQREPETC